MVRRTLTPALALALVLVPAGQAWARSSAGPQAQPDSGAAQSGGPVTEESLARIREGLTRPESRLIPDTRLRFYALVIASEPTAKEIIGNYDLVYGPTRGGNPMTHQEFLNMVTPRGMYGSGGIQAYELLQWSLVNWAGQAIVRRGIEALQKAQSEREIREIRERIDRELAELRRRQGGGG
jgi:hypothetical protein